MIRKADPAHEILKPRVGAKSVQYGPVDKFYDQPAAADESGQGFDDPTLPEFLEVTP
jgi:hypothetical protein